MAGKEKELPFLFIVIAIFIVVALFGWAMWTAYHPQILTTMRWFTVGELYLIDIFVKNPDIAILIEKMKMPQMNNLTFAMISPGIYLAGSYMKFPFALLFIYFTVDALKNTPNKMFRDKMDLDGIIKFQSQSWPSIKPFVNYNPGAESSRKLGDPVPKKMPTFAESLAPQEWLVHKGITVNSDNYDFDENKAKQELQKQLDVRWRGVDNLDDYAKALFAGFALKLAQKRSESDDFLGEISGCWTREKGLVLNKKQKEKINKILKDPKLGGLAVQTANNHAYLTTAMLGVLETARKKGGVLAPAQFLWLKGVDRNLWYVLNSLGRKTHFAEGAGATSHYFAEKALKKPIVPIQVDSALNSIKDYLQEECPIIPPSA
jgi:intracellular multiplication protein IcmP